MKSFKSIFFKSVQRSPRASTNQGFTLTELLVAMLIAGGIISGLMYLVVELLTADQRESIRTETQQEMQMAMDYIGTELREAIYIYEGACLGSDAQGNINRPDGDSAAGTPPYCPGLYNHLPESLTPENDVYPILAFWKQQQLPANARQNCTDGDAPVGTPCTAGSSYALVVYSLSLANSAGTWDGRARITRYMLSEFDSGGDRNDDEGYVNPGAYRNNFRSWPYYQDVDPSTGTVSGVPTDRQAARPVAMGSNPAVLVDFVDDGSGAIASGVETGATCPNDEDGTLELGEYVPTFSPLTFTGSVATAPGFYACISVNSGDTARNRDVILYVRGNLAGRPGVVQTPSTVSALPTLETRVLSRPVLGRSPQI